MSEIHTKLIQNFQIFILDDFQTDDSRYLHFFINHCISPLIHLLIVKGKVFRLY